MNTFYEQRQYNNEFPFYFEYFSLHNEKLSTSHWHESLELLYFVEGNGIVFCNMYHHPMAAGDLAIVNSGELHAVYTDNNDARYYCLIIGKTFSDEFGVDVEALKFKSVIHDEKIGDWFIKIAEEKKRQDTYSNLIIKSAAMELLVYLCRNYLETADHKLSEHDSQMVSMVKDGISYIRQHFQEELSTEDVCLNVGFSKCYFCRVFKKYTGTTVMDYINFQRCSNARSLLFSGTCNVSESARMSGIYNLSYFTKLYKRYMGVSPSQDCRKTENT